MERVPKKKTPNAVKLVVWSQEERDGIVANINYEPSRCEARDEFEIGGMMIRSPIDGAVLYSTTMRYRSAATASVVARLRLLADLIERHSARMCAADEWTSMDLTKTGELVVSLFDNL